MTEEQKAAFIMAQCACAMAETFAMNTQNFFDGREHKPLTYKANDFRELQQRFVIGHNAVIEFMR